MNVQVTFKNMDSSDAIRAYAEKKLHDKIGKLVYKPATSQFTLAIERHNSSAHLIFTAGKLHLEANDVSNDMYVTIDHVIEKLDLQLRKHLAKRKDHKKDVSVGELEQTLGSSLDNDEEE